MSQGPAASFDTGRHLRYSQRLEAALREVLLPPPQQPPPGTGAQEPEATLALGAEAGTGEGAEAEAEWGASSSGVGLLVVRAQELDDPRFDAEEAVNRRFPDPASLDRLEEFVGTLEDMIKETESQLKEAVQRQSTNRDRARATIEESRHLMQQLAGKVGDIKGKSEKSEAMVQEICKDIKELDNAKRNLSAAISTLQKVQNFEVNLQALRHHSLRQEFGMAAECFKAVSDFSEFFREHSTVPRIRDLQNEFHEIRESLESVSVSSFRDQFNTMCTGHVSPKLEECVQLLDALGSGIWEPVRAWVCTQMMQQYVITFSHGNEDATFEKLDRRFVWLKRLMHNFLDMYDFFPPEWNMLPEICVEFCLKTRQIIKELLDAKERTLDVNELLRAIESSRDVEKYLTDFFKNPYRHSRREDHVDMQEGNSEVDAQRAAYREHASAISAKYRRKFESEFPDVAAPESSSPKRTISFSSKYKFGGMITSCFQDYMDIYVSHENTLLQEAYVNLVRKETWAARPVDLSDPDATCIFESATTLFICLQKSFRRAIALNREQALCSLSFKYKDFLHAYAQDLENHLPKGTERESFMDLFKSADKKAATREIQYRLSNDDLAQLCFVCSTAEYCYETVKQLEDSFLKNIAELFRDRIKFEDVLDRFTNITSHCVRIMVGAIMTRLSGALESMSKLNWGEELPQGDTSPYVLDIINVLQDSFPVLMARLSRQYRKFLCDKFVSTLVPRFAIEIYKCKRISESGATKLLMDLENLKQALNKLPHTGPSESEEMSSFHLSSYLRVVNKEVHKVNSLLKFFLVSAEDRVPPEQLVQSFNQLIGQGTLNEFQKLLEMKGIKSRDQNKYVHVWRERFGGGGGSAGGSSSTSKR